MDDVIEDFEAALEDGTLSVSKAKETQEQGAGLFPEQPGEDGL